MMPSSVAERLDTLSQIFFVGAIGIASQRLFDSQVGAAEGSGLPARKSSLVRKPFVCDRQLFASELVATWTARLCSRENGPVNVIRCQDSPFSAVRLVDQELRKMAVFRSFLGKRGREFSALQTGWRRGRDSICA